MGVLEGFGEPASSKRQLGVTIGMAFVIASKE